MTKTNTLGLVGDGDDLDILVGVETCFDIMIEDEEAEALENVGDLFDLILLKLGPPINPKACFSANAFYALKSVFREAYPGKRLAPYTPLLELSTKRHNEALWAAIESKTNFQLPNLTYGWGFWFSWLAVVVSIFLVAFHDDMRIGVGLLLIGLFGVLVFRFDHGRIPFSKDENLGDLTRAIVAENFKLLVTKLGGYREQDAWATYSWILAVHSGVDRSAIDRETIFFSELHGSPNP